MSLLDSITHFFRTFLPIALMPPAGLLWVVIAGFLIARVRPRLGGGVAAFGLVMLYLLSMPATSGFLIAGLATAFFGAWAQRRWAITHAMVPDKWRLDFSDPTQRRYLILLGGGGVVFLLGRSVYATAKQSQENRRRSDIR